MSAIDPTSSEREGILTVRTNLKEAIRRGETIKLPPFDGVDSGAETAFHLVGLEPNPFGGVVGEFRYQFEGEEDLLHLIVTRIDGSPVMPEEGQTVAALLLENVPPGLVWFKPGRLTQHFSFGHESLLDS